MTLLGQAKMIEGIIPNMITFNIFDVNFLFKKLKDGLIAWVIQKHLEKNH